MKSITKFVADDGKEFDSADACRAHEEAASFEMLVGLTTDQLQRALSREDGVLADAIERLGRKIQAKRLEAGETRRTRKPKIDAINATAKKANDDAAAAAA